MGKQRKLKRLILLIYNFQTSQCVELFKEETIMFSQGCPW
jgi:hypothetical protein